MKRSVLFLIALAAVGLESGAADAPLPEESPGAPKPPIGPYGLVHPPVSPRPQFFTNMPMDLVRIRTLNPLGGTRGDESTLSRVDVEVIAPNARVRDYVTTMPIFAPDPFPTMPRVPHASPARPCVPVRPGKR